MDCLSQGVAAAIRSGIGHISSNTKALDLATDHLLAVMDDVMNRVGNAEVQGFRQTEEVQQYWLKNVELLIYEVDDEISKMYRERYRSFPARFFNYRSNHWINKFTTEKLLKIQNMLEKIEFGEDFGRNHMVTTENFLNEIAGEKPIRFSPEQQAGFTQNYSTEIGSGGYGAIYKGKLPNGMPVDHMVTIENFLNEIAGEKPIRFSPEQLAGFTQNYSTEIGSGGYGAVYKGKLLNGMPVAVKVLHGNLDKRVEQTFKAEVGTIGRTYHRNLVRLIGFCFDPAVRALVYEYMENGGLDNLLFKDDIAGVGVSFSMLHEIAVGIAKGIRYLHEECHQKIIHYDIKPENILLDDKFTSKVADFGLAKLLNRENTHASGRIGTPGYAAPETWTGLGVTEACDVYSFGILLFEIVGRRKNYVKGSNGNSSDSWLPRTVWESYNSDLLAEFIAGVSDRMDEEERSKAERMCKVALWCVQYEPSARPPMSKVVKMLEGDTDIPSPLNPFQHLVEPTVDLGLLEESSIDSSSINEGITEAQSRETSAPL